ncbi:unnamed protein product [Periconia digitata]|uniref:Uncharacterized protein n=1 Tax=Periconia digitata TaxID=1303443 RepID=A0A9W4U112_9PLEO|nr:unnamed protein product [Periconia digitata]
MEHQSVNPRAGDDSPLKIISTLVTSPTPEHYKTVLPKSTDIPSPNEEEHKVDQVYNIPTACMGAPKPYNQPRMKMRRPYSPVYITRAERARMLSNVNGDVSC